MPRLYFALTFLVLVACRNQAQLRPADASLNEVVEDTTIGPGDLFEVRVFGEPNLTNKYMVAADGTIQFPFLGAVQAGGKEPEEVARLIATGLKDGGYLREPHVSVLLQESNSKRLSVLGAVARPGTFPIIPGMSVIQAISQAGGFTPLADKDGTVITRKVDGKLERFRVPVSAIARGTEMDIPLRAGDIVFVPERIF